MNRRVRFCEDSHQSSGLAASKLVENIRNEEAAREASSRTEQLENVRLAAQRAHDAAMLARSMRADIRSSNSKLQKSGQDLSNENKPQAHNQSLGVQAITSSDKKYDGPQLLDILKDQEIMAVPMAWISNVLLVNK